MARESCVGSCSSISLLVSPERSQSHLPNFLFSFSHQVSCNNHSFALAIMLPNHSTPCLCQSCGSNKLHSSRDTMQCVLCSLRNSFIYFTQICRCVRWVWHIAVQSTGLERTRRLHAGSGPAAYCKVGPTGESPSEPRLCYPKQLAGCPVPGRARVYIHSAGTP